MEGGGASRSTDPAAGTSQATDVSLREYLNEKIHSDRKLNNERFAFVGALAGVIWFFIERHLKDLNHENERILKQQETTISKDTYDANEQQRDKEANELDDWRKDVDKDRTQQVSRAELNQESKFESRAKISTVAAVLGGVLTAVVILGIILQLLNYQKLHPSQAPTETFTVTTTTTTGGK